jgi:hypothetical protein
MMNLKRIAKTSTQACETQNQTTQCPAIEGPHRMCDMQVSSSFEVPLSPEPRRFPHSFADRTWLRIRHVKCDEAKPACLRCTSTGRRCDGYVPTRVIHLNVDVPGDYEERRGYHYFRLKSVGEILRQQDADFWESLFLQASHSQLAVKHALIAVASVHESLELSENHTLGYNGTVARKRWTFSLIHYNKAIQLLIKDDQQSCD